MSEYPQGRWHETFEFNVTFHAQLFDTIQLDLYDANILLPDRHVGRAEIRLRNLENMPETFTSYYEIWEKRLSSGASSKVGRTKTMATNVGAIQAKISYAYQKMEPTNTSGDLADMGNINHIKQMTNTVGQRGMTDEMLAAEFRRHLKHQRELHDITFRKYEEKPIQLENDGLDYPDESASDRDEEGLRNPLKLTRQTTASLRQNPPKRNGHPNGITPRGELSAIDRMSSMVSSWFGSGPQPSKSTSLSSSSSASSKPLEAHEPDPPPDSNAKELADTINVLSEEDDSLKTFPLLDTIGSWTVNKETNQVLRAIGRLLAAFVSCKEGCHELYTQFSTIIQGQGFELSNLQILTGFTILEKFYMELPRDRTWDVVEDLSEIELAAHFWKFSVASYGWKGLNFIGKGNGYISDAMRDHSDALSIIEYLSIPKEDLLAYEFRSAEAFRPSYFIARDRSTNSIVLCIRGTMVICPMTVEG